MSEQVQLVNPGQVFLSGLVDIETVARYRTEVVELLEADQTDSFAIDLKDVNSHGSAIIALLIAIYRDSKQIGKQLSFQRCPELIFEIAKACGVEKILPLDSVL